MFRFTKSLATAVMFVIFAFTLGGCGQPAKVELANTQQSPQGVVLEDYLPEDTLIMVTISTQDADQRKQFKQLMSYFPQKDINSLWQQAILELSMELEEAGLTYEEDIAPIFSEQYRATLGLAGEMDQDDPDIYVAFTVADSEKTQALLDTIIEDDSDDDLTHGTILGATTINDSDEDMYLALYKDTIILTNREDNRDAALKRVAQNQPSLRSNELFHKSYKQLPKPYMGIIFINVNELFTRMQDVKDEEMPSGPFVDALYGETFAITAEEDGLQMIVQIAFDENEEGFNFNDYPYEEPYMYHHIPGENIILYSEAYGMKDAFDIQMQAFAYDEESMEDFERFKALIKGTVGLDFDEDMLSWMDKGFAMVVQPNKSIIPGISFYVDAQSDPESAQKVLDVIDAGMTQAVESMKQNMPKELDADTILRKDTVRLGDSDVNRVSFDVSTLSEEELLNAGLPSGVFIEPIEIYYGLTDQEYFLFSTYTGLDTKYETAVRISEDEHIKEAQAYLKDYPYQISYISIEETIKYVKNFVSFIELVEGPMDEEAQEMFNKVMSYFEPITYLVGSSQKTDNVAEGMMFVKIEQPTTNEEGEEETEEVAAES